MAQKPDEIASSTAANAYHVAQAVKDASEVQVSDRHLARAKELMTLAFGVGISTNQSCALIALKLDEWAEEEFNDGYRFGANIVIPAVLPRRSL